MKICEDPLQPISSWRELVKPILEDSNSSGLGRSVSLAHLAKSLLHAAFTKQIQFPAHLNRVHRTR